MKSKPFSARPLAADEVSAVSGGLTFADLVDGSWRYPLPTPIFPMPPQDSVSVTPIEVTMGPDNVQ